MGLLVFSPSGTPCHLPHQREARDGANLKHLYKWGLVRRGRAVKREFFEGKFAYGQSAFGRKSGKTVNFCRKNYVNRFAYRSVWITPVEKSVDNVEKYEFSTVIHRLWREKNLALSVHTRMHNFGYSRGFSGYVARGN